MGGDDTACWKVFVDYNFNPRLPDGRRHANFAGKRRPLIFQSTPPGWEATMETPRNSDNYDISIHASRMGGDYMKKSYRRTNTISIHASRMGGDRHHIARGGHHHYFNPRLPDGRRRHLFDPMNRQYLFQSTPPGWEATVKMDTPFHDMERIFILVINRTALY